LVLAAGGTNADSVKPAMGRLLETYWYPLYAFIRRKGRSPDDAADLTQELLTRLIERNCLSLADPTKGRFRTFLLTALDRFLVDAHRRRMARRLSLDLTGLPPGPEQVEALVGDSDSGAYERYVDRLPQPDAWVKAPPDPGVPSNGIGPISVVHPLARGRANARDARSEDDYVYGEYDESEQRSSGGVQPAEARRDY